MSATVSVSPNPAIPGSTVAIEGAGFTPKLKIRIKDAGDVWRSRADGGFSVGLVVSTTPRTQTVVVQQQVSGAWVTAWSGTVTVQAAAPPPPPPPVMGTINVAAGGVGIRVTADDTIIANKIINGPQSSAYNGNERGISAEGSASNPIANLTIRNCQIKNFGHAGIFGRFLTNILIEDCTVDDVVYTGIQLLSCIGGTIRRNTVRRVGMKGAEANSNNAYGIGVTEGSGGPRSSDVFVEDNTVEDVPTWEAMDTHGGLRITFARNIVRRSRRGVMLTSGSAGPATECKVTGNQFLEPVSVPVGQQYAIAPVNSVNSVITGNTITGWGAGHDMLRTYPNPGLVYTDNVVTP